MDKWAGMGGDKKTCLKEDMVEMKWTEYGMDETDQSPQSGPIWGGLAILCML